MGVPPCDEERDTVRPYTTANQSPSFPTPPIRRGVERARLPYSPSLCRLLHDSRHLLHQHLGGRVLAIQLPIRLCDLTRLGDQHSEIGTHAGIHETDVRADRSDLLQHRRVEKQRRSFLLSGEHDAVCRFLSALLSHNKTSFSLWRGRHTFDAQRGGAACYGRQGMFDLHELAGWGEGGEGEAGVRLELSSLQVDERVGPAGTWAGHGALGRPVGRCVAESFEPVSRG